MKPNWNEIAREVAALEGKKVAVNIAQIKEVLRCFCVVLWRRYFKSHVLLMGFLGDLTKQVDRAGGAWSDDNDSN